MNLIIDNKKEKDCKILFNCKHIDDLEAYAMLRKGIKITPENAPVSDFELMLIENTDSPYGFSAVCKRNKKLDVWEYDGYGHSSACSMVTALLKQLQAEKQKVKELEEELKQVQNENLKEIVELIRKNGLEDNVVFQLLDIESEKKDKYKQALEEIKEVLKISITTTNGDTHFEYVENAFKKVSEVLENE